MGHAAYNLSARSPSVGRVPPRGAFPPCRTPRQGTRPTTRLPRRCRSCALTRRASFILAPRPWLLLTANPALFPLSPSRFGIRFAPVSPRTTAFPGWPAIAAAQVDRQQHMRNRLQATQHTLTRRGKLRFPQTMTTEADSCRKLATPKLRAVSWDNEPHYITGHCWFPNRAVLLWHECERTMPVGKRGGNHQNIQCT